MKTRSKTATSFLKLPDITIGTDLGDKSHAICVMSADGESIEERKIRNDRDTLHQVSDKYRPARIAMEVGSH